MESTTSNSQECTDNKTTIEQLRDELAAASTHTENPNAEQHLERAVDLAADLPPTPLVECPVCGKMGLPERIVDHDCASGHVR
jgi:hypothetical protein